MANYKAANATKYVSGPALNNTIPDGNVKTVEKLWVDSFAFTSVLTTADTLVIAYIPKFKKIMGVDVYLPSGFAPTSATINVGISGSTSLLVSSSTAYVIGNLAATGSTVLVTNRVTMNTVDGVAYEVLNDNTPIYLSIGVTAMTSPTAGTIKTVVRYT